MPAPRIDVTGDPDPDDYLKLWSPLLAFNQQAVGEAESRPFAILLHDPEGGELLGGLWARSL